MKLGLHIGHWGERARPHGLAAFSDIQTSDPEPHHEIVDLAVDAAWRPVAHRSIRTRTRSFARPRRSA